MIAQIFVKTNLLHVIKKTRSEAAAPGGLAISDLRTLMARFMMVRGQKADSRLANRPRFG